MSSRCTWPASFLAAGCFVLARVSPQYANLHVFLICIYGVVVFVYQCKLHTFYNPSAMADCLYALYEALTTLKQQNLLHE